MTPQFCTAEGIWQDVSQCSGEKPVCNGAGVCGACKIGEKKCDDSTPYSCVDGDWLVRSACSGATPFCSAGDCTATCPGNGGPTMKLLPEGYCIDTTEVTRQQYQTWLATGPVANAASQTAECAWNDSFIPDSDATYDWPPTKNLNAPVRVDWCDANAYCLGVGKRLCGKIGGGPLSSGEMTTTTSEWFNACTSHGAYTYTYGDEYIEGACNAESSLLAFVGTYPDCHSPIAAYDGVYDLSGNEMEWEDNCEQGKAMDAGCSARGSGYYMWGTYSACDSTYSSARSGYYYAIRCCSS